MKGEKGEAMKRFGFLVVVFGLLISVLVSACAAPKETAPVAPQKPGTTTPTPSAPQLTAEQQLMEAAKKEGEVSFWTHTWAAPGNAFETAWKAKYPGIKLIVWEASTASEAIARMSEEAKVGRRSVDVVIFPDVDITSAITGGLLQEYEWPNTRGWDHQPNSKIIRNIDTQGRAPVYNTKVVTLAESPKTYNDLKDAKWAGKAMISTSGRDTPIATAYIFGEGGNLDWDKSFAYWREVVAKAKPRIVTGYTEPLGSLAAGEVGLFMWVSLKSTIQLIWKGAPLGIAALEKTPASNTSIGIVKNAPHPNAARLLADFFTSSEGALAHSETVVAMVFDPVAAQKAKVGAELKRWGVTLVPLPPELMTAENNIKAVDFWTKDLLRR
ncbi:MAG: fbpA 2 [Dehalococcoidia bacterium]|nr:fbpA 2 [Dehalococcoidia bacterium]